LLLNFARLWFDRFETRRSSVFLNFASVE